MTDAQVTPSPAPPDPQAAEIWAGLTLKVGNIEQQLAAAERRRQMEEPIRGPRVATAVVPASGTMVLDLGAPAMGRRWVVRNVGVSDAANVRTAAAGAADLYVGNPAAYSPNGWRWPWNTLPAADKFTSNVIVVIPTDHLFVVITGATAGQTLQARADVDDYPLSLPKPVMSL